MSATSNVCVYALSWRVPVCLTWWTSEDVGLSCHSIIIVRAGQTAVGAPTRQVAKGIQTSDAPGILTGFLRDTSGGS